MTKLYGVDESEIRKELHRHPELSGEEAETAKRIVGFLEHIPGIAIRKNAGAHGIVAWKRYGKGPMIGFRAELDALPIREKSNQEHRSRNEGKSHACGHDGHMTMLLAMMALLEDQKESRGGVVLHFQSAEETGKGARLMLDSSHMGEVPRVEICFAIHNIPGRDLGKVLYREGSFACASVGARVRIEGRTAHAAHPERAINPLAPALELLDYAQSLPQSEQVDGFALSTPVALIAGEESFGTTPAEALLAITLRAAKTESLEKMMDLFDRRAYDKAEDHEGKIECTFLEYFPATQNAPIQELVRKACHETGLDYEELEAPFRWSEDFGHFAERSPIAMMGLGSGLDQPELHAPNFDFPDALIQKGANLYRELYKSFIESYDA